MKRILFLLFAIGLTVGTTAMAGMSTSKVRKETRFLTDKMAYELSLSTQQYNDAYEINYDFIYSVRNIMDYVARGYEWALDDYYEALDIRNDDLRWVLSDAQYRRFLGADYFYRPIYITGGRWSFRVYVNYPNRSLFYFGLPYHYRTYCGAHYRPHLHHVSFYRDRYNFRHYPTPYRVREQRSFHSYRRSDFGSVHFRPNSSVRPHNAPTRPGVTGRPSPSQRPSHNSRPGTSTRPGTTTRPGSSSRPSTSVRPESDRRPTGGSSTTASRPNRESSSSSTSRRNDSRPSSSGSSSSSGRNNRSDRSNTSTSRGSSSGRSSSTSGPSRSSSSNRSNGFRWKNGKTFLFRKYEKQQSKFFFPFFRARHQFKKITYSFNYLYHCSSAVGELDSGVLPARLFRASPVTWISGRIVSASISLIKPFWARHPAMSL